MTPEEIRQSVRNLKKDRQAGKITIPQYAEAINALAAANVEEVIEYREDQKIPKAVKMIGGLTSKGVTKLIIVLLIIIYGLFRIFRKVIKL